MGRFDYLHLRAMILLVALSATFHIFNKSARMGFCGLLLADSRLELENIRLDLLAVRFDTFVLVHDLLSLVQ